MELNSLSGFKGFGDPLKQLNETIEKIVEKFEVKQEEIDRFETLFQDSSLNAKLSKYERDTLEEEESRWKALYNYCIEHGMEIDGNISLEHLTRIASRVEEKEVEQLEMMDIDMDDLDDMDEEEEEDLGVDEDDDIEEDEEMPMEKDNDTSMIATTDNKNNKNNKNKNNNKSNNKNNNREILYAKNQNITVQLVVDDNNNTNNNNDGGGVGGVDHTGNKNNHCYSDKIIIVRTLVNGEFLADYIIANDAFFVQYMGYTRYRTAVDRMLKVMRGLESVFSILTGPFIIEISHGPIVRYACKHALIGSTQQNMKLVKRDVLDLIYHFNYTEFSVRDGSLSLEKTEKIHRLIQWKPPISPSTPSTTTTTSSTLFFLSSQHNPNTAAAAATAAAATISNSNNNNNDNNDNNNSRRRSSTSSTSSSSSSIGNDTEIHLNNDKGNQLFHLAFLSIQFNDNGKKKNTNRNKNDYWIELYSLTIRS